MQLDAQQPEADEHARRTAWLSQGLEALVAERPWIALGPPPDPTAPAFADVRQPDFDVVIVGSGYGASVAAAALAGSSGADGKALRVCVLERGREYLAGMFPSRLSDLAGHTRFATARASQARGVRDGLFDLRLSEDATALIANGLGGGSLINAGVMAMPHDSVFGEARWPQEIRADCALRQPPTRLLSALGAHPTACGYRKTGIMDRLGDTTPSQRAPITVAAQGGPNSAAVLLDSCIGCGDCATGCNHNAKNSLDTNLLRRAQAAGARIFTGATVLRLERGGALHQGWVLHLNHTDGQLREHQKRPFQLRACRVILAAGTLGSTEILMRSRSDTLRFSSQLGRKFSANGDMIVVAHDLTPKVNAVADEDIRPSRRRVGPTITTMIDLRTGDPATDVVIQDLSIPGPLRRLFEQSVTSADLLLRLVDGDFRRHDGLPGPDDAAVDTVAIRHALTLALIGRDDAEGELRMASAGKAPGDADKNGDGDGLLTVYWPALRNDPRLEQHHTQLKNALAQAKLGGRVIDNPMWRPLPDKLENVFGRQRGPLLTVHPLGGCAMADDIRSGVTDHLGRVFDADTGAVSPLHEGLVVLDGSIVPTSLGINPALTISVLAQRAITQLKILWRLTGPADKRLEEVRRPSFRVAAPFAQTAPAATMVVMTEQMRGVVDLRLADGRVHKRWVEITLTTEPARLASLMARDAPHGRMLHVNGDKKGWLRIFRAPPDAITDEPAAEDIEFEAPLNGTLQLFALERSHGIWRAWRGFWAWICNRGLRDIVQNLLLRTQRALDALPPPEYPPRSIPQYLLDIWRLASRAGAVRLLTYDLTVGDPLPLYRNSPLDTRAFRNATICGVKRMTYQRCTSPWTQLSEMEIQTFPSMVRTGGALPRLVLNQRYLARQQVPLLRFVGQQDRVAALVDLTSFVLYVLRMVLQIHALSFRKPDAPLVRPAARLPGQVPGLPPPQIQWLTLNQAGPRKPPVQIRLARYRQPSAPPARPVLLIHGYSASGTTYAHRAVPDGLAKTLCDAERDVWILDLRSSSGMTTARGDWAFEDMAMNDIPVAIDYVLATTAQEKLDVVAHCMGAAMFSMAVLATRGAGQPENDLGTKIGRVVFSQIGPVMVLSPANVLRAYGMRYVRYFLQLDDYAFSPVGKPSLADQLFDRALATFPVPAAEYRLENPLWPLGKFTPWVGTRHRMDALYARTFSLANLSEDVLGCIDDFFGPLSIQTVSQVIHFAQFRTVTDRTGMNQYVNPDNIRAKLRMPILSIHGEDNGLSDVATLALMRKVLRDAGFPYLNPVDTGADPTATTQTAGEMRTLIGNIRTQLNDDEGSYMSWRIAGHGHQDCLIGKQAGTHCAVIRDFLRP